ncbi:MAG TPA: hypothetical protein DIW47_11850 [Bacteroidetes bacterium]|nr:hypothetical protein [Bacteroidota bacterium]
MEPELFQSEISARSIGEQAVSIWKLKLTLVQGIFLWEVQNCSACPMPCIHRVLKVIQASQEPMAIPGIQVPGLHQAGPVLMEIII